MSYCKKDGKDVIIFATKESHQIPSTIKLPEPERSTGIVRPDGSLNFACPCLGGMATGPCGVEFREAFSCFHYSKADPKGSDCADEFSEMQDCMKKYPKVYGEVHSMDPSDLGDEDDKQLESENSRNGTNTVDKSGA